MFRPPYGTIIWACEALAVLVVVLLVLVLVPVEVVELEVAAAVAGREESFASVYDHEKMISFVPRRKYLGPWKALRELKTLTACLKTWKLIWKEQQVRRKCLQCTRRTGQSHSCRYWKA